MGCDIECGPLNKYKTIAEAANAMNKDADEWKNWMVKNGNNLKTRAEAVQKAMSTLLATTVAHHGTNYSQHIWGCYKPQSKAVRLNPGAFGCDAENYKGWRWRWYEASVEPLVNKPFFATKNGVAASYIWAPEGDNFDYSAWSRDGWTAPISGIWGEFQYSWFSMSSTKWTNNCYPDSYGLTSKAVYNTLGDMSPASGGKTKQDLAVETAYNFAIGNKDDWICDHLGQWKALKNNLPGDASAQRAGAGQYSLFRIVYINCGTRKPNTYEVVQGSGGKEYGSAKTSGTSWSIRDRLKFWSINECYMDNRDDSYAYTKQEEWVQYPNSTKKEVTTHYHWNFPVGGLATGAGKESKGQDVYTQDFTYKTGTIDKEKKITAISSNLTKNGGPITRTDMGKLRPNFNAARKAYDHHMQLLQEAHDKAKQLYCSKKETVAKIDDKIKDLEDSGTQADLAEAERLKDMRDSIKDATAIELTSDYKKKELYREQCFLLSGMHQISNWKKRTLERKCKECGTGFTTKAMWRPKKLPYEAKPDSTAGEIDLPYLRNYKPSNASLLIDGEPYAFINRLTQSPSQKHLFEAQTQDLSSLQPMVRLFKVTMDSSVAGLGSLSEQEFSFDQFANPNDVAGMSEARGPRMFGVGIKSFNIKYDGSNPFAVKKSIKANLKIFAANFTELLTPQPGGYRYVDLALKTGGDAKDKWKYTGATTKGVTCAVSVHDENTTRSKLNFRLKAVIGWAALAGSTKHFSSPKVLESLYDSFVTINLTPTVHNFEIDELGRVVMNINYLAYVEDFYDQQQFSIFTNPDVLTAQSMRKLTYKYWDALCDSEQMTNIKDSYGSIILEEKRLSVSHLIKRLIEKKQIFNIRVNSEGMESYMLGGPFKDPFSAKPPISLIPSNDTFPKDLERNIKAALKKYGEEDQGSVAFALTVTNPNEEFVSYFYLSDLIDNILEGIESGFSHVHNELDNPAHKWTSEDGRYGFKMSECDRRIAQRNLAEFKTNFQNYRVVLGPLEIEQLSRTGKTKFVNLGDVPISVKYFVEFLTEKLSSKEEGVYLLSRFLNDMLNGLVRTFLNDDTCWDIKVNQRVSLQQAAVSGYREGSGKGTNGHGRDEVTNHIIDVKGDWCKSCTKATDFGTKLAPDKDKYDGRLSLADVSVKKYQPLIQVGGRRKRPDKGNPGVDKEVNYMVYSVGRTQPAEYMKGNKTFDEKRGIFHYILGRDKGIIRNIDLQKTQTPGLQEVRFEQSGYDGLKQLLVQYDVNIDTYLNVKAFPGTYLFVDPRGFDPASNLTPCSNNNLTEYGIGGYYMIITSEHTISADSAPSTKIVAKWVNKIGHDAKDEKHSKCATVNSVEEIGAGATESTACATWRAQRKEDSGGLGGTTRSGVSLSTPTEIL